MSERRFADGIDVESNLEQFPVVEVVASVKNKGGFFHIIVEWFMTIFIYSLNYKICHFLKYIHSLTTTNRITRFYKTFKIVRGLNRLDVRDLELPKPRFCKDFCSV